MNVLITGGAGYIGGTVATILLEQGHKVTVLDSLIHARRNEVPAGVDFIQADIADRPRVEALLRDLRPDGVLHFAALIEAGDSMRVPEVYFRNNTASTLALLEAMHATGTQNLVFSSTAAVYGEPKFTPIEETADLAPTNAYGESKLLVEHILRWMNKIHGLRYAALRYFNVAGSLPHRGEAHEPETHIIPLILDVALGRRASISIFGDDYDTPDGTCIRDYIHVADLADAHILALNYLIAQGNVSKGTGSDTLKRTGSDALKRTGSDALKRTGSDALKRTGSDALKGTGFSPSLNRNEKEGALAPEGAPLICNLGNGSGFSVKQVIEAARRVTGHAIPVEIKPRRPGDPARLVASSGLAKSTLGWTPKHPNLDDILASAWAWHQQRYKS